MERTIHIEIRFTRGVALALLCLTLVLGILAVLQWRAGPAVASPGPDREQPQAADNIAVAVGNKIHYQGRLEGANGLVEITFRLWSNAAGTLLDDLLWEETKTVEVSSGLFNTQLGDTRPLRDQIFGGEEVWLSVEVEHDGEMVPRQEILPVPYAMSLRPGARIAASLPDDPILHLSNTVGAGLKVTGQSHTLPAASFYNPFGVAVRSEGSIQSTEDSYQWFPGSLARVRVGTQDLSLIFHGDGKVKLDATGSYGDIKRIVIPLTVPAVLYGQPVTVESIRVPYHCASASDSSIPQVVAYRNDGAGNFRTIGGSGVEYSCAEGTSWRNIDLTLGTDTQLSTTDGILSLDLAVHIADQANNEIYIGGVRVGLGHDAEPAAHTKEGQ